MSVRNAQFPIRIDPYILAETMLTDPNNQASDAYGFSMAASAATLIAGAPGIVYSTGAVNQSRTGAAYVYTLTSGAWKSQATLSANDGNGTLGFGTSVSISGNLAVVGSPLAHNNTGAAFVFIRSGSSWTMDAELTAADGASGDYFGWSVATSGTAIAVSAVNRNQQAGAVYVFTGSGSSWSQQAEIIPSDVAAGDQFGNALYFSGSTLAAACALHNNVTGAVYVYQQSGSAWPLQAEIADPGRSQGDYFGASVSVSRNTMAVGAIYADNGLGAVYLFTRSGTSWSKAGSITPSDAVAYGDFGIAVALSGSRLAVGADGADNGGTGRQYLYSGAPGSWTLQNEIVDPHGSARDLYGASIALSLNTLGPGAPGDDAGGLATGAAYADTILVPKSVSLSPTAITGGQTSTGTVTLNVPVPSGAGPAIVNLHTNSPDAWTPTTISIPSGAPSAQFVVHSKSVTQDTPVTVTAQFQGGSASSVLTVAAPVLVSLTLNPNTVKGGNSVQGTVTLSGTAAADTTVTLTNTNSAATVPASVIVKKFYSSVKFTIATSSPGANSVTGTVTATLGANSSSASLTVTP
ncbi:MAG TPA: FG-GAP repeat protein [Chthonomonadales bacterium]|nr:FG-GAP repeat protein [Chthonomonadales bacterium]